MSLSDGLAIIISSLSVVATVIGWTVVYRQQKQIIETQAEIDTAKEKKDTRLKILLAEIDSVYSWLNEGHDLVILSGVQDPNSLKQRLLDWQLKYNKEIESCRLFEYDVPSPGYIIKGAETRKEINCFYNYVVVVVNARVEGDETKALEILTHGEYMTYEPELIRSNFGGFDILLPEGFLNDYVGPRLFLEKLREGLLQ